MRILISLGLLLFGTHSQAQDIEYQSPWWLPGGDVQTIYTSQFINAAEVTYERERWELEDGDFLDLDWVRGKPDAPVVVLFHGLEGNSSSFYARNLMFAIKQRGWNGVVAHFRGCSGEDNRLARAYFAGDSAEISRIFKHVASVYPHNIRYAVGVSLGGNALLKWAGEQGELAKQFISSAAGISAPLDLTVASNTLDSGFNRSIYTAHFLKTLKAKALRKAGKFPELLDAKAISKATTFREFDTLVTAKLHGFRDAADYWEKVASIKWLPSIRIPTLVLNAKNDPFLPAASLPSVAQVSSSVTLEQPEAGGHVAFPTGGFPGHADWLAQHILNFLQQTPVQK
jgi:predicted alpha/beta-fold hydrolase